MTSIYLPNTIFVFLMVRRRGGTSGHASTDVTTTHEMWPSSIMGYMKRKECPRAHGSFAFVHLPSVAPMHLPILCEWQSPEVWHAEIARIGVDSTFAHSRLAGSRAGRACCRRILLACVIILKSLMIDTGSTPSPVHP